MRYFLSLGSNLGDRRKNLAQALRWLDQEGIVVLCASSIYRTQPVGFAEQPWFYNQVVEVRAPLEPHDLLRLLKKVEQRMRREPTRQDGPRTIDIDILLAGNRVVETSELVIPHPRLHQRNFVLVPLVEISADTVHPQLKMKIADLLKKSKDPSWVERLESEKTQAAPAGKCPKKTSRKQRAAGRASSSKGKR